MTEHEHCIKCGRRLYCAASKRRGYGWGCWAVVRKAMRLGALINARLAEFTARQLDQARELIEDAAIIPAATLGLFYAVSSDGSEIYRATLESCDCPASKECYHQAAVLMVTA